MKLEFVDFLFEAQGGRPGGIPHPEETVLEGSAAAVQALQNLANLIKNPQSITIKWDGSVALVFGRLSNGQLSIMDKYMYDAKFFAQSPEDFQKWDEQKSRGGLRGGLYDAVKNIWPGLDAAVGSSPGFFWGDLMWSSPPPVDQNKLMFKGNKVTYKVPVQSPLGQRINGRTGGIAVHQYASSVGAPFQQWSGQGLKENEQITILKPTEGKEQGFSLGQPVAQLRQAQQALSPANAKLIDRCVGGLQKMPATVIVTLRKYLNELAKGQTRQPVSEWLQANISQKQYIALVGENQSGYLFREAKGWLATQTAFLALNNLKNSMAADLERQIPRELEQYVGGQRQGEGFVFQTPQGLGKLVNKAGFTAAAR